MTNDLVSIIIPAFNREELIRETLDSVLAQTYQFWEALVIDDGSTDKTCEIVNGYSSQDQRIRLIKRNREPKGASVCRNIGIENAKGKYAVFLDSDDLLSSSCIERRVIFMDEHSEFNFAVFQMTYFNNKGPLRHLTGVKKRENYLYAYLRHDLPWNITCPIWSLPFIKTQLYGYNEHYPRLQDPEFNTRALLAPNVKFEVLYDAEPDSYCRVHSGKVFNTGILLRGFTLYIEEFAERTKNLPDYKECRQQLKQCYVEAVRGFYTYYKPQERNQSIRLLVELNKSAYREDLIGGKTYLLTGLLILAYKIGLNRMPLGKYMLRTIMKLIKMS